MENSENRENESKNSISNENEEKLRDFADSNYYKIEENSNCDSSSEKKRAESFSKIRENPSFVKSN